MKMRQRGDINNELHEEWGNITMAEVRKLIGSMQKTVLGGHWIEERAQQVLKSIARTAFNFNEILQIYCK